VRAFIKLLHKTLANIEDAKQLLRSSGSVGSNCIEANEALSKMRATRTCDHCGAPLDQYAPEGVCPRCMLNAGLLEPASGESSELAGPTASPEGLFSPNWRINLGRFGDYELLRCASPTSAWPSGLESRLQAARVEV
jgi:hypothetical protein